MLFDTLCGDCLDAVPRMSALCHVWTAPGWQELSSRVQHWSVLPCVRPLSAAHGAAGHNALRESGPGSLPLQIRRSSDQGATSRQRAKPNPTELQDEQYFLHHRRHCCSFIHLRIFWTSLNAHFGECRYSLSVTHAALLVLNAHGRKVLTVVQSLKQLNVRYWVISGHSVVDERGQRVAAFAPAPVRR
jgi:hypothetical protein